MKQYKLAITFGRFNLLHRGHIDLFRQMGQASETVSIGVSTGPKNLHFKQRSEIINTALKADPEINEVCYQVNPKHSPFGMFERNVNWFYQPEETVIYLGHDQFELGKRLSQEYGIACVTIPRLTSSTTIRSLIDNEEWVMLSKEVPSSIIHQVVLLREQELCPGSR